MLPGVKVPKIVSGSVAEAAGMRRGDVIVAVGDRPISNSRENVNRLVQYIKYSPPTLMDINNADRIFMHSSQSMKI